jgi:S-adenosylmethionine/arginine decarboxylase-like enzyme
VKRHGKHVKALGRGASVLLGDPDVVRLYLRDLVDAVGMRMLGVPLVHEVEIDLRKRGAEPFEDEGGVTGVCVLSTSHASIHTWPAQHFFVADLYSCRQFDEARFSEQLVRKFGAFRLRVTDVSNGLDYEEFEDDETPTAPDTRRASDRAMERATGRPFRTPSGTIRLDEVHCPKCNPEKLPAEAIAGNCDLCFDEASGTNKRAVLLTVALGWESGRGK